MAFSKIFYSLTLLHITFAFLSDNTFITAMAFTFTVQIVQSDNRWWMSTFLAFSKIFNFTFTFTIALTFTVIKAIIFTFAVGIM